jgi:formamidopyrimidine-DNA glycosylase
MPELPEVEMTRRSFAQRIAGAQVRALNMGKPLRWPLSVDPLRVRGLFVGQVQRRAKYLLMPLHEFDADGRVAGWLLWHLGMSGSLSFGPDPGPPGVHDHANLLTSFGVLRLHDPRRFGAVIWVDALDSALALRLLGHLGPEPWDTKGEPLDATDFYLALQKHRSSIKQVLLAGEAVVGVGNIYASEALFLAGIRPTTPASRIGPGRALRLRDAVCDVLRKAIHAGGSTLRDFKDAHGNAGGYQQQMWVYDRGGKPCLRCEGVVQRVVQGQRSTYFCPRCQKP